MIDFKSRYSQSSTYQAQSWVKDLPHNYYHFQILDFSVKHDGNEYMHK